MLELNTKGLNRKALEQVYELVVIDNLKKGAKLDRIKKELSTAFCAIEDGVATVEQVQQGLANLINYIDTKISVENELNDFESMELVEKHKEEVLSHYRKK